MPIEDSIVLITSADPDNRKFGTGFVIHTDADWDYVLTCRHVVVDVAAGDHGAICINYQKCTLSDLFMNRSDDPDDMAILKITGSLGLPPLKLGTAGSTGDKIRIYGYYRFSTNPDNHRQIPVNGEVGERGVLHFRTRKGHMITWDLKMEETGILQECYSGSPVIREGTVAGVVSHRLRDGQMGVAISIDLLSQLWPNITSRVMSKENSENGSEIEKGVLKPKEPAPGTIISGPFDMKFAFIPVGSFLMGSPEDEPGRHSDESPQHPVTFKLGFYMQTTEVTQGQWKAVMGDNPSYFQNCGDDCPVDNVSWEDIKEFIRILNKKVGKDLYRLPTEAEWEYAARGGSQTAFANGVIQELKCGLDPNLDQMGWYCGNSEVTYEGCFDLSKYKGSKCAGPHPVAKKQPNQWGIFDMHGNVWEWCEDDWHSDYDHAPDNGSAFIDAPKRGELRVLRGGSWSLYAGSCRSAKRSKISPDYRFNGHFGFRLARSYP